MRLEKFEVDVTTMSDATLKRLHEVAYGKSSGLDVDREVILAILEEEMARRRGKPTSYTMVLEEKNSDSEELADPDAVERKDGE